MGFAPSALRVTSLAFDKGSDIPRQHTGDGDDLSPALQWENAPTGTQGFAVVCYDPDAPLVQANGELGFVHWLCYNLGADTTSLEQGAAEFTEGVNDFGEQGYNGPMPPEGHGRHAYYFWVLALDTSTQLPSGLTMRELLTQVEPHILGMNRLVGHYQR